MYNYLYNTNKGLCQVCLLVTEFCNSGATQAGPRVQWRLVGEFPSKPAGCWVRTARRMPGPFTTGSVASWMPWAPERMGNYENWAGWGWISDHVLPNDLGVLEGNFNDLTGWLYWRLVVKNIDMERFGFHQVTRLRAGWDDHGGRVFFRRGWWLWWLWWPMFLGVGSHPRVPPQTEHKSGSLLEDTFFFSCN